MIFVSVEVTNTVEIAALVRRPNAETASVSVPPWAIRRHQPIGKAKAKDSKRGVGIKVSPTMRSAFLTQGRAVEGTSARLRM